MSKTHKIKTLFEERYEEIEKTYSKSKEDSTNHKAETVHSDDHNIGLELAHYIKENSGPVEDYHVRQNSTLMA